MNIELPWSREAEQALLGAILSDHQVALERSKPLKREQFFDVRHGTILSTIQSMVQRKIPVDVVTVYEEIGDPDLLAYLNELSQSAPSAYGAKRYAEIIREKSAKRELIRAAQMALEIAKDDGTGAEKIDKITSLFLGLQKEQVSKVPKSLAEVALLRTQHYEDLQTGAIKAGWPTHIGGMDRMLNGGFRPGGLYILAARPSIGKSSLAQSLGLTQAKAGRKTLFLSQEMSNEELADRGVSNTGRVSYANLLSGNLSTEDWGRASEALAAPAMKDMHVDDQGSLTLADIRAKAKLIPNLQVLILDYLQLCAGDGKNRNAEIEQISRGLKSLAKELNIAIISLSQLNRAVEQRADRRPNLSDLRDSGAIEQDADVVMFLWVARELSEGAKLIGLGVDKNRQGRTGTCALHFDGNYQFWSESTESLEAKVATKSLKGFE